MSREARMADVARQRKTDAHVRRQRAFRQKFAAAANPSQRVSAAADYLRGTIAAATPTAAGPAASEAVRALTEIADRLAKEGLQ